MNSLKKLLIELSLQKKYGKLFSFTNFPNGNITFHLKKDLDYDNIEYIELPKVEDVKDIMKKYHNKDIDDVKIKTYLYSRDFKNGLKINCNGENLTIDFCSFDKDLKIYNADNFVFFSGGICHKVYINGNLEVNAKNINFTFSTDLKFMSNVRLNANRIIFTNSKVLSNKNNIELNAKDYIHFYHSNLKCNPNNLKINSKKIKMDNSYIKVANLNINSSILELDSNNIETKHNAVINSDQISSKYNNIVSDRLIINNKNNNGLNDVSANFIIYNNNDVTYMANREFFKEKEKLIKALKNIKKKCELQKKSIIEDKTKEIEKEVNNESIQKLLNKK